VVKGEKKSRGGAGENETGRPRMGVAHRQHTALGKASRSASGLVSFVLTGGKGISASWSPVPIHTAMRALITGSSQN
jgi:hypothetical protein